MTYDYLCTNCEHTWETLQSINENPITTCPQCKQEFAKRLISGGSGFQLKGSGWAKDLYSSSKSNSRENA